ncbi:MAG: 50S ribosomal protein L19e [Candidatus Aenigmarchaeota archaeon]|nr:50S ribosomal protein L19e [Candidatus Aenigmarchaeota archaeon]
MNLQRKLAAKVLKCGVEKIWIDPKNEKVRQAITRRDIRRFIKEGVIKKLPEKKKVKRKIKKRQQKTGSRKGSAGARIGKKTNWLRVVRPQRRLLKELKEKGQLKPLIYRKIYKMIKGNAFRSKAHLMSYLRDKELLKVEKK